MAVRDCNRRTDFFVVSFGICILAIPEAATVARFLALCDSNKSLLIVSQLIALESPWTDG